MNTLSTSAPAFSTLVQLLPAKRLTSALTIVGASLIVALAAQIEIPLLFTPVPLTLQTLAVLVVGAALGARKAAAAMALYLAEGLIGLPVFSGGALGFAHLIGPTGGYLMGFIPAAALAGWIAERGMDRRFTTLLPSFLAAHTVIFFFGLAWLSKFVGFERALALGYIPFIGGEVIKSVIATVSIRAIWRSVPEGRR